ncbi:hypothetical protein ABG768_027519 [Culter alburnus]|uniref:Uncharacterized protein n=1 Tax=Culter alburnus TaxID=194366 RepID=A0AAW2A9V8_CULAL
MEVNSPTRQSFPSGGQRLRKAPAPPWQGLIIERHESSPLPILCVLCIGIRVPAVSQEVGANEYDWNAGVSLHSYCAIFDALLVISRAKSLRAITLPYGIYSTYVPLAAGSTTVHPTYACTSAAEPHFPGSKKKEGSLSITLAMREDSCQEFHLQQTSKSIANVSGTTVSRFLTRLFFRFRLKSFMS